MKFLIPLFILITSVAKADVCYVEPYHAPYTFSTSHVFRNCSDIPKKAVKGEEKLQETLREYGYKQTGIFFQNKNIKLLEKIESQTNRERNVCLVGIKNASRRGLGEKKFIFNCTDVPYLNMYITYDKALLLKHMKERNYELVYSLNKHGREEYLFQENN